MSDPVITFDEIMAEIGKYEGPKTLPRFTATQIKIIESARATGMSWIRLAEKWERWYNTTMSGARLCNKYHHERERGRV